MQFQERLEHTFQLSAYVALLIDSLFICHVVLLFSFHYERTAKTKLIFMLKKIAVESEKHKDELDIRMAVNLEKTVQ